jgi:hypothetical protein
MRRLCMAVVTIAFCLFIGCKKQPETPVCTDFQCGFTATYQEMQLEGTLKRNGAGTLEMTVSKPETLSGMQFIWDGEKGTVALGSLRYSFDMSLPLSAPPQLVQKVLDTVFLKAAEGSFTEYGACFQGKIDGYEFSLLSDAKNGTLLSLEIPKTALYIEFKDFQKTA